MKILHVITSLRTGGAERLMVDLLPRFKDAGIDVDLLVFDGTQTPFRKELEAKGIRIMDFGEGGSVYNPSYIPKLRKIMKGYDIVHTHNTAPQFFAALAKSGKTHLVTTEHSTSNRRRKYAIFRTIDKWMYSRYSMVISISPKTEELLKSFIGKCKTNFLTIPNGVNVMKYANAKANDLKGEYPVCTTAIVHVAGFRFQKDQDTVINTLSLLPDNIHLFLVGDGERRIELENLTQNLGLESRVHFMGVRSDVDNIIKSADIAVMSSHWEGFGLAAVEAMAAGIPVIASDVDGLREVVKGYGVLFPHQDSETLAKEIMKLDSDPAYYKEVADRCRRRADVFDISRMAEGYIKVYNEICH